MPSTLTYQQRRGQLLDYFDRTAVDAWKRLTSDVPVSGVRATVREGRLRMRNTLLSWLPDDLQGVRILDAGCGTCVLAAELAERGADVLAIDLSPTLVRLGEERFGGQRLRGRLRFAVGDFADPALGHFDHIIAMDSLIHYSAQDTARALAELGRRTRHSICFTYTPSSLLLTSMLAMGRLFPRSDRSPAVVPVQQHHLHRLLADPALGVRLTPARSQRVSHYFYKSQALEVRCA